MAFKDRLTSLCARFWSKNENAAIAELGYPSGASQQSSFVNSQAYTMPFVGWISYSLRSTAAGQWLNVYDRRNNFVPYEIRSVGADQLLTAYVPFAKGDVFSIDCSVPGAGGSIYFLKAIGAD